MAIYEISCIMGELLSGYAPGLPERTIKAQRKAVSYFVGDFEKRRTL